MSRDYIVRRTVAENEMFAALSVSYPAGNLCTCTDSGSGKTFRAGNTSGIWAFAIPYPALWVLAVNAPDGINIKTQEILISADDAGKAISVALSYTLYLCEDGVLKFGDSDDKGVHIFTLEAKKLQSGSSTGAGAPVASYGSNSIELTGADGGQVGLAYINEYADFSDCDSIIATGSFTACSVGTIGLRFVLISEIGTYCMDNVVAEHRITASKSLESMTLDLSSLESGERKGYVGFIIINNGTSGEVVLGDIYGHREGAE